MTDSATFTTPEAGDEDLGDLLQDALTLEVAAAQDAPDLLPA